MNSRLFLRAERVKLWDFNIHQDFKRNTLFDFLSFFPLRFEKWYIVDCLYRYIFPCVFLVRNIHSETCSCKKGSDNRMTFNDFWISRTERKHMLCAPPHRQRVDYEDTENFGYKRRARAYYEPLDTTPYASTRGHPIFRVLYFFWLQWRVCTTWINSEYNQSTPTEQG